MPELKKKQSDSTEKVEQQDTAKVEKKKPVKAQPETDKDGGIFATKIIAIMNKLRGIYNE